MNEQQPLKVIAGAPDRPLIIGDIEIPCYVLDNETRVLVQRGLSEAIGMSKRGDRLARFSASKSLKSFISKDLEVALASPLKFFTTGGIAHGYPATLLVDLCNVVLSARDAGVLQKQQAHIAKRCDILIRALATVGIIALVDEATGYQDIREQHALATILEKFIAKELQPWTKTFPYQFYEQIFRLRGWKGPDGIKRPSVIGHYTNDIVYARLAPGVLDELRQKNPTVPTTGRRRSTHHQWFTPAHGHPKLKEHLVGVMALMRASPNWTIFHRNLVRSYPKVGENIDLPLDP